MSVEKDDAPFADEELPPIDPRNADAWEQIEASKLGPRMRRALQRYAGGKCSLRDAAAAEDYKSWTGVWKHANRFGLLDLRSDSLMQGYRHIAHLTSEVIEERLLEDPGSVSVRDAAIVSGIAVDKVDRFESRQKVVEGGFMDRRKEISGRLIESGASLEVTVKGADPALNAIDVTPGGDTAR